MLRSFRFPFLFLKSRFKIHIKSREKVPLFFYPTGDTLFTYQPFCSIKSSASVKKEMDFATEKDFYLKLSLSEKRSHYHCKSNFVPLEKIPTWAELSSEVEINKENSDFKKDDDLNKKVSMFRGDITALEIDAIVNAANRTLRGGGGVDGAIHRAAGRALLAECVSLHGCATGEAKITGGYKLPAKYVIHTVGPMGEYPEDLINCYRNSLTIAKENGARTIAFPCISTGVYGYPNEAACLVALSTVRDFLEKNGSSIDRVIFCLFMPIDVKLYELNMPHYFPI